MSAISGLMFGLSDYPYGFTSAKENSHAADAIAKMREQAAIDNEQSGCGCCGGGLGCACSSGGGCRMTATPRIDEYIPSFPRAKIETNHAGDAENARNANDATSNTDEQQNVQAAQQAALKSGEEEFTSEEREIIEKLAARDREVRAHEQAHAAAGGAYVISGPSYTYQTGPDGRKYAIGGEVQIDTSPIKGDPEATLRKMQTVIAAAMAPAEPSSADNAIAAAANQAKSAARAEIAEQTREEARAQTEENKQETQTQNATEQQAAQPIQNEAAQNNVVENTNEVQNQIVAAISAYTSNSATLQQLSASVINLVA
jgi:hypothetical protein